MDSASLSGNSSPVKEMPKTGPLSRLKNTPKDIIPVSKVPRRQRSSRFHVTDKVELEKLPAFKGIARSRSIQCVRFIQLIGALL